jgi:hypothetical protein
MAALGGDGEGLRKIAPVESSLTPSISANGVVMSEVNRL